MKKMNKKGFTLIEMLVVIAIIAVLVSIVIPTVNTATEKAREAADVANIRSAVATVTTNALANGENDVAEVKVKMTQEKKGFQSTDITSIGGIDAGTFTKISNTLKNTEITIAWDATADAVKVTGTAAE